VAAYAKLHDLPLWQTSSLKGPDAESRLRELDADELAAVEAAVEPLLRLLPEEPGR